MRDQGTLGLGAAAGLVAALGSVNRAMRSLPRVLDLVHGRREMRGFLARTALSLGFTLGSILFALSALSTVVAVPLALDLAGLGEAADLLLRILRWPLLLGATTVLLACIYRYESCRAAGRWRWVSWGGAFAALAWLVSWVMFALYVESIREESRTYGPLGAMIGFVTWLWPSATVALIGAALNAELEREAG